ncbi:hypothetical protein [Vibrio coralliilyticus]|uniref:Uncharacterized protein n=1 Tax=Vibrio coralliilyticus TaxID=190893 RepID=A0AAP6ZUG9_9VIBR|nr:hypothetical protein [Vibrio coralliilyticus]NOI31863.1 hypothetical protein [Vibrio coralliilyticus]NOJ25307.1 hypothetical protein [Vibrio coralliilyticus]
MELSKINELMTKHGFGLRSWDDRYGKGVWVCIARNSYPLEEVEDASGAGDLDMIPATDFLLSQEWLPFAIGNDLADGLTKLENRLSALPESELSRVSQWSNAVDEVLEHLKEVTNSSSDYGNTEGQFNTLSSDFRKIWE